MSVQILPASLESHQDDLIGLFNQYLASDFNENRFCWLYKQNPYGPARAWIALDDAKGVIGAAAAFPRRFYFKGTESSGWVLGDFCLSEEFRSLGPALKLQRACMQSLEAPHDFLYDFPSKPMMAIYSRLRVPQTSTFVRWAKPLRMEDRLESVVHSKTAAALLGKVGNVVLDARGWKGTKESCEIELHRGQCGEAFTALDQSLQNAAGIRAARPAAYLNWRFLAHPSGAFSILTARKNGALIGYVVVRNESQDARIVDLVSVDEPAVVARLIDGAISFLKPTGAKSVSLAAGESHPWNSLFERTGFRRREASPVVVVSRTEATIRDTDFKAQCYLMEGDRDS
jgi:hypothetical protein